MIDLKNAEAVLKREQEELLSEIKKIGIMDQADPGGFVAKETNTQEGVLDEVDVAAELENIGNNNAILIELESRLMEVEDALDAIKNGTYGKCLICDDKISEKRLLANPAATTCIKHG